MKYERSGEYGFDRGIWGAISLVVTTRGRNLLSKKAGICGIIKRRR
jgi:hypothetical protein